MTASTFDIVKFLNTTDESKYRSELSLPGKFDNDTSASIDSFIASELGLPIEFVEDNNPSSSASFETSSDSTDDVADRPACPICGCSAGKHMYYGVRTCVSCRGFFRRMVQSKAYKTLTCLNLKSDQPCEIDSKTRKSCKYCRFKKCVDCGMNIKMVGDFSSKKKKEMVTFKLKLFIPIESKFYPMERKYFEDTMVSCDRKGAIMYLEFFSANPKSFTEFMNSVCYGEDISIPLIKTFEKLDDQFLVNWAAELDDMLAISAFDRMSLLMENCKIIYGLSIGLFSSFDYIEIWLDSLIDLMNRDVVPKTLLTQMEHYRKTKEKPSFDHWYFGTEEDADKLLQYYSTLEHFKTWLIDAHTKRNDLVLQGLLYMIALFNPGSLPLQDANQVQKIQDKYVWQLQKYLKFKYKNESSKYLHNILLRLSCGRFLFDLLRSSSIHKK